MIDASSGPAGEARGPFGDPRSETTEDDPRTGGGQPVAKPEDRPNVGSVKPDDYPDKARGT